MTNCSRLPLVSVLFALLVAGGGSAAEEVNWKGRFLEDAPRRWQEYLGCTNLQGSWDETLTDQTGKTVRRIRLEFLQNKTCAWVIDQNLQDRHQTGQLFAINARYGFQLRRQAPGKSWVIVGRDLDLTDGYNLHSVTPKGAVRNWLGLALTIDGSALTRLYDVIKDPDFCVQQAAPLSRAGRTLVRIDFTSKPKEFAFPDGADWMPLREGSIILDPEHYWVLVECRVQSQHPLRNEVYSVEGKFEYKEGTSTVSVALPTASR
jgi:hypothetical protein